jgi:hypothetical protein
MKTYPKTRRVHTYGQMQASRLAVLRKHHGHRVASLIGEIETAGRVHFELSNAAVDAYDDAALTLANFQIDGTAPTPSETQALYALFEVYGAKLEAAGEVQSRRDDAIQRLILELRHPMPDA